VSITQEIEKFQNATGALITGSVVLKVLANEPWTTNDLDIIVPLNETSISAFTELVRACVPEKERDTDDDSENDEDDEGSYVEWMGNAHITKYDSLRFPSFQPRDNAAFLAEIYTEEQAQQQLQDRAKLTAKFSDIKDMYENYGYQKHVRAVYFAIDSFIGATDKKMDIIFVPEEDLNNVGGLVNWMKYYFDFQICANAILPNSAYCLAPLEISNRIAHLRLDQYCCDVTRAEPQISETKKKSKKEKQWKSAEELNLEKGIQLTTEVRWNEQFDEVYFGSCNCTRIVPDRVTKYEERGYKIETGTCTQYKEWRKTFEENAKY
jgi:hypothetical protein